MNNNSGIGELLSQEQYERSQRHNAIVLFQLLLEEKCTDEDLIDLVTRESLFQLVLHAIDHAKTVRAKVNANKSNQTSINARSEKVALLHKWLDQHIGKYNGRLAICALDASKIPGLGRGINWCREEIAIYRKLKKESASTQ